MLFSCAVEEQEIVAPGSGRAMTKSTDNPELEEKKIKPLDEGDLDILKYVNWLGSYQRKIFLPLPMFFLLFAGEKGHVYDGSHLEHWDACWTDLQKDLEERQQFFKESSCDMS